MINEAVVGPVVTFAPLLRAGADLAWSRNNQGRRASRPQPARYVESTGRAGIRATADTIAIRIQGQSLSGGGDRREDRSLASLYRVYDASLTRDRVHTSDGVGRDRWLCARFAFSVLQLATITLGGAQS